MKIRLFFVTPLGFEWLDESKEVTADNYKEVITDYNNRMEPRADALVDKWMSKGEENDCELYFDIENIDVPQELWNEMVSFMMKNWL